MTPVALPPEVSLREVGPRDGLQLEAQLATEAKVALLQALAATGLPRIEATSFVSPRAVPALADAEQVAAALPGLPGPRWSALVASPRGAARAVAAGLREVAHVVSASDGHSLANAGRTCEEAVGDVALTAQALHDVGGICEVIVAVAWDCPFDGRTPVARTAELCARAVELGADQLCLGDTIGTTSPGRVWELLDAVRGAVGTAIPLGVHLHDTRGMGAANGLAAVQAGVTMLDASIGGLGGCPFAPGASGNLATEELVYLLEDAGVRTGVDLDALLDAARLASHLLDKPLPSGLLRAGGPPVARGRG